MNGLTVDVLEGLGVGSRVQDTSGDTWVKRPNGNWDCPGAGSEFEDWSSSGLRRNYSSIELLHSAPEGPTYEQIKEYLRERGFTGTLAALEAAEVELTPKPEPVLQNLVVTITVPVQDRDPMGDVWADAERTIEGLTGISINDLEVYDVNVTAEVQPR